MFKRKIVIFSIILLLAVVIFEFYYLKKNSTISAKPLNPARGLQITALTKESQLWSEKIDALGAELAYEEFKQEYADESYGRQHSLAHIFGALLYEKVGLKGVAICDQEFAFGCYHSFFGVAIANEGYNVLPQLKQACVDVYGGKSLPCEHGLGHGIMTSLPHEKLVEALDTCWSVSQIPMGGCSSGIFMEYNFRTMEEAGEQILTRERDERGDFYPCSTLPQKYRPSCFFEQTQWWQSIYGGDHAKIGSLCERVDSEENRRACYWGMGNYIAPFTNHDADKTTTECRKLPNDQAVAHCIEGASWIFLGIEDQKDAAYTLCQSLKLTFRQECLDKLAGNPAGK